MEASVLFVWYKEHFNLLPINRTISGDTVLTDKKLSRKGFLKILGGLIVAAGASGVLWEILRPKEQPYSPRTTTTEPSTTSTMSTTTVSPTTTATTTAYTQNGKSLVSIVEGNSDSKIESLVRQAVIAIGGIEQIVSPGKMVVVKPAVLTSDPNCAPDPRTVAAVAKLAKEAGGTVVVAENSASGGAKFCLSKIGITSAIEELGVEVIDLISEKEIQIEVPKGKKLQKVKTYPTISNCDVLISVPRLKRHGGATVTISLKNMMGAITQSEMSRFHREGLSQCIADLNTTIIRPDLTVVDATYAMTRTGPTGGKMVEMHTIMASRDPVAVDRVAAQSLHELEQQNNISSFNVADVKHINNAAALGVGKNNLDKIIIVKEHLA